MICFTSDVSVRPNLSAVTRVFLFGCNSCVCVCVYHACVLQVASGKCLAFQPETNTHVRVPAEYCSTLEFVTLKIFFSFSLINFVLFLYKIFQYNCPKFIFIYNFITLLHSTLLKALNIIAYMLKACC